MHLAARLNAQFLPIPFSKILNLSFTCYEATFMVSRPCVVGTVCASVPFCVTAKICWSERARHFYMTNIRKQKSSKTTISGKEAKPGVPPGQIQNWVAVRELRLPGPNVGIHLTCKNLGCQTLLFSELGCLLSLALPFWLNCWIYRAEESSELWTTLVSFLDPYLQFLSIKLSSTKRPRKRSILLTPNWP